MLEQLNQAITYFVHFTASKLGKTGLTVTIDVWNPARTKIVTAGAVTELGDGLYYYVLASTNTTTIGEYPAVFHTADTTVDAQDVPVLWEIGRAGIGNLDAPVSSRLSTASYTALPPPPPVAALMPSAWAIFAGDDITIAYTENQPGTVVPQNITGWSFVLYIKTQAAIDDAFAVVTCPGIITSAALGQVSFPLTAAQTTGLFGLYPYVIRAVDAAGGNHTVARGTVIIKVS